MARWALRTYLLPRLPRQGSRRRRRAGVPRLRGQRHRSAVPTGKQGRAAAGPREVRDAPGRARHRGCRHPHARSGRGRRAQRPPTILRRWRGGGAIQPHRGQLGTRRSPSAGSRRARQRRTWGPHTTAGPSCPHGGRPRRSGLEPTDDRGQQQPVPARPPRYRHVRGRGPRAVRLHDAASGRWPRWRGPRGPASDADAGRLVSLAWRGAGGGGRRPPRARRPREGVQS